MTPYVYRKITIEELVKKAKEKLLESLIQSQLQLEGIDVKLSTSVTNWGGKRIWFVCPNCNRRCGKILETQEGFKCNNCLKAI